MARLMVHRNILKSFSRLPSKVQKRIPELIEEFQRDPLAPAIGMHPLPGSTLDPKVRGVTKLPDGYRAIVIAPEKGDTYLLVHIDSHDKAYDWAKNKRFEVHGMTGVFQVFDADEVQSIADQAVQQQAILPDYPLAKLTDDQLFEAGVPRPLIPAVKSIHSDAGLEALMDYLPPDCRDVLFGLAAGLTIREAMDQMIGAAAPVDAPPESPGDFTGIQETPNFDLILVHGGEELKQILSGSLDEWRIFLHPYQRKLVNCRTTGPLNVTGAAGTGKTVALMHRAVQLARRVEDSAARILVTTFTTNLSVTIRHHIQRLAPDLTNRIEVTNLHALARTICSRAGWKGRLAEDEDLAPIWEEVWLAHSEELPLSRKEVQLEYELVVDPNGIDDEETYLTTVRSGRPRITRPQRKALWPIFRAFQRGLKKRTLLTFEGAVHEARMAVELGRFTRYAHVLVDEVQDFSLEALRLIRAISPVESTAADPLCLFGDGHQRIYRTRFPMSRAGIDIRGRSRRFKINYRTSEQIRQFAGGILKGVEIDDLDGGSATTTGDHSVFRGPQPLIRRCPDEKSEAAAIVEWIQSLQKDHGLATHEICITPRKPRIITALSGANIATFELKPREEDPGSEESGVRVGTMKRIKGLEFRAVVMACAKPDDPMNNPDSADIRDRCERYVAATRAREHLLVTVADRQ
jgi:hypothetical protein